MGIIERVLWYAIICTAVVAALIVLIWIFIVCCLKGDKLFKRVLSVGIAVTAVVAAVLGNGLSKIILDIQKDDYITYRGEYIERGGGQRDLKTVVVYDGQGREIRLLRTGPSKEGTYEGTVVYGRRSKIVVEYSGTRISD